MHHEKIKLAYMNAAKLVKLYGDQYLPIFERLHMEFEELQKKQDIKAIALSLAET